jgi:hypothetical protein
MVMLQTGPGLPVFELRLRNTGDHDLVVNIGMLAGTKQYPEAFHFFLLDASGTAYQLLRKGSLAGIAGRIAPLIVALPVEASFSFPVDLALYCSFAEGCPLRLTPSRYTIKADYYSSDQQTWRCSTSGKTACKLQPFPSSSKATDTSVEFPPRKRGYQQP